VWQLRDETIELLEAVFSMWSATRPCHSSDQIELVVWSQVELRVDTCGTVANRENCWKPLPDKHTADCEDLSVICSELKSVKLAIALLLFVVTICK
jgi:hypothetical protein